VTTLREQLAALRRDLSYAQSHITELTAMLDDGGHLDREVRVARAGSPRELRPDACPDCELAGGHHTVDCPRLPPPPVMPPPKP
jgi:hypothetical protein